MRAPILKRRRKRRLTGIEGQREFADQGLPGPARLPLLYEFCEFFGIQYVLGIPANCVFQRRAEPLQKKLKRRYRRTELPQRSFSSFRHRARSWSRQRHICFKAEHTAVGTNLRFLITNVAG